MQNEKSRLWNLLLYPDDPTHVAALEFIKRNYDYVGILHDKDIDDDFQIKKSHYHIIIKFPQARYSSAIAKELHIKDNYIDKTVSWNHSAIYLLHLDSPDKYQYPSEDLFGNLVPAVIKLISKTKDEDSRILDLISLFDSIDSYLTFTEAIKVAAINGLYSDFRRAGYAMRFIIDEHNSVYKGANS